MFLTYLQFILKEQQIEKCQKSHIFPVPIRQSQFFIREKETSTVSKQQPRQEKENRKKKQQTATN